MATAIVYATYDGIISHYCGVGSVSRDFILSFQEVYQYFKKRNKELILYPITVYMKNNCYGYSEKVHDNMLAHIKIYPTVYADIQYLDNGTNGENGYGNTSNWMYLTGQLCSFINELSNMYNEVICIGLDAPFAGCAEYYQNQYPQSKNAYFVYVLYSSSVYHRGRPFQKLSNYSRFGWEHAALSHMKKDKRCAIYACGDFFKKEIMSEYALEESQIQVVYNGIYFDRMKSNIVTQEEIASVLRQKGIPTDKKILFSFGRCEQYKGFEYVLEAAKVAAANEVCTVLLLSQCENNAHYLKQLHEQCHDLEKWVYFIEELDTVTPQYMMQWQNTLVLALLSVKEPSGLIPVEARFYDNPNMTLVVSDRGGLPEQVNDGEDGFVVELNVDSIQMVFNKIFNLSKEQKAQISHRGKIRILEEHNVIINNIKFLESILEEFQN